VEEPAAACRAKIAIGIGHQVLAEAVIGADAIGGAEGVLNSRIKNGQAEEGGERQDRFGQLEPGRQPSPHARQLALAREEQIERMPSRAQAACSRTAFLDHGRHDCTPLRVL